MDDQIQETLEAIRRKDPRVYDSSTKFFSSEDANVEIGKDTNVEVPKPLFLSEYHRRNLLHGDEISLESQGFASKTFADEQTELKKSVISGIQDAASCEARENDDDTAEALLITKERPSYLEQGSDDANKALAEVDISMADDDPEEYLSKYMTTRAWVPSRSTDYKAFNSDDEEHDRAADEFEEAYNLRFEDSSKSNEKLMSHARDIVAKHSVRKTTLNSRQRTREATHNENSAARQLRKEEKARLRKLKIDAVQRKLQQIKEAAGISDEQLQQEDWSTFLNEGWDDGKWEFEMQKRFGAHYYEEREGPDPTDRRSGRTKLKKPKWEDDIDISDIVPTSQAKAQSSTTLHTSHLTDGGQTEPNQEAQDSQPSHKRDIRLERQRIERIVDEQMDVDEVKAGMGKKHQGLFRYRETSPLSFGLTAQDILMASDSQLNQHAGLKKYAAFRDSDKKSKDNKMLSKNARVKKWRKETFGNDAGPKETLAEFLETQRHRDMGGQPEAKFN